MSQNPEKYFLSEVRKRQQKKIKRIGQIVGVILLIVGVVIGLAHWLRQSNPLIVNSLAIPAITLFSLVLVSIVIFRFVNRSQVPLLRRINPKYFLGYSLLVMALIYQANPSFLNPLNNLFIHLVYNPTPPISNSPWPWKDRRTIHPIVANMPSNVETSIKSVAEYIAQHESDPYLRIKALHDYVISRTVYDLDVLKTGIRPSQDAQTVFQTHKAVCEGYANLFMELGRAIGEKIVYIEGKIRRDLAPIDLIPMRLRLVNPNYDWTLHAWNAVKILDNWQLVDVTWDDNDTGAPEISYTSDYLMLPPKAMAVSHSPRYAAWQLQDSDAQNSFENKPILTPSFFAEKLELISPSDYQTKVEKSAEIKIKNPQSHKQLVAIFTKTQQTQLSFWELLENEDSSVKQRDIRKCETEQNAVGETQISCQFKEAGDYQVFIVSIDGKKIIPLGQLKFQAL